MLYCESDLMVQKILVKRSTRGANGTAPDTKAKSRPFVKRTGSKPKSEKRDERADAWVPLHWRRDNPQSLD